MALGALMLAALCLAAAAPADWKPYKPPPGQNFFGATDTGKERGFRSFARAVDKHPPIIQTFHPYGNSLHQAMPRWRALRARPLLHISTLDEDGTEIVAPRGIAKGKSDEYLLRLNRAFARSEIIGYIRPLGEPNRCLNIYAAYDCSGASRGERYAPHWYRQAFRRMAILLHGGGKRSKINQTLKSLDMPGIRRSGGKEPKRLPKAPIAIIWSPLPTGSPMTAKNRPGNFFPGARWVDWIGTDFYSKYPYWSHLKRFYAKYAKKFDKPFALTEWGVQGGDAPGFVRRLFAFVNRHERARMLVYYQDFGLDNEFRIQNYPYSKRVHKMAVKSDRWPGLVPVPPEPERGPGGVQK